MSQFVAQPVVCANPEKEETLGIVLSWLANNVYSDLIRPAMKRHGLELFAPNQWYPTQTVLNTVRDLYRETDAMDILVAIGKRFAQEYPFDPKVRTVRDAIFAFNQAYRVVHRGIHGEEGLLIQEAGANTFHITNNTPWPGETIYGVLWTMPSRFEPGRVFSVHFLEPDDSLRSVFEVTWN